MALILNAPNPNHFTYSAFLSPASCIIMHEKAAKKSGKIGGNGALNNNGIITLK